MGSVLGVAVIDSLAPINYTATLAHTTHPDGTAVNAAGSIGAAGGPAQQLAGPAEQLLARTGQAFGYRPRR